MTLILRSSNLYWRLVVLCGALSCGVTAPAQSVSSYDKQRGQMMLDQVKNDIESHYYDPKFHGIDLDRTFKAASEKIKNQGGERTTGCRQEGRGTLVLRESPVASLMRIADLEMGKTRPLFRLI